MTVWPIIFVRRTEAAKMKKLGWWEEMMRHEKIHCAQQQEMLAVGLLFAVVLWLVGCGWWSLAALPLFFWWYGLEFLIRRLCGDSNAYRNICFEREAYRNQYKQDYLDEREIFTFIKYIMK